MFRLLIVDDEPIVRLGLKTTIDWKKLDIEIVDEAKNGKIGVEKALLLKPDIIITDIKMPIKSGIEMIKELREAKLDCEFIVLSGFGEFEFAKKAIEYNVVSYLLKPVSNEELMDTISRTIDIIKNKRKNERLTSFISERNEDMKRRIIRTLVRNDYEDIDKVENEVQLQGLELIHKGYFLIGILDDCNTENPKELSEFESLLVKELSINNIKNLSGIYHERVAFIVEEVDLDLLDNLLFKVNDEFKQISEITISIGVSSKFESCNEIHRTYEEAKSVANNGLLKFTNSVQYFNAASKKYSSNLLRALDIINKEYPNEISVNYVSEKLNVSESYLMHMFKNELGQTFNNVLIFTRIREAKILLKSGKYRVNEISYRVGFNDEKYFTFVFKKKVGMTPSEFAKKGEKI